MTDLVVDEVVVARVAGNLTDWTFQTTSDYMDVTTFGDMTRTYVVNLTLDFEATSDGGDTVRLRFPWRHEQAPLEVVPPATPADPFVIRFNHATTTATNATRIAADYQAFFNQIYTPPTPEQAAARLRAREEQMEAQLARRKETEQADKRAMTLLYTHLTHIQRRQLASRQNFEVKGEKLTYVINSSGGVNTKNPSGIFCVHPKRSSSGSIPGADQALALKLMIETDEAEFLRVANWTGSGTGPNRHIELGRMGINGKPRADRFRTGIYGGGGRTAVLRNGAETELLPDDPEPVEFPYFGRDWYLANAPATGFVHQWTET